MFLGTDREHAFTLLPGEQRFDEFTLHHQHLYVVRAGTTRVTLTTHRILFRRTRVFSPLYWLLLVLFPPLMLYYVFRITRNRNVSMPLRSIDSFEKKYYPNWFLFVAATVAAYLLAGLCTVAIMAAAFDRPEQHFWAAMTIRGTFLGILAPAVLVLLLATRTVGIEVRSRANKFDILFFADGEKKCDAFLQSIHAQMERVRALDAPASVAAT